MSCGEQARKRERARARRTQNGGESDRSKTPFRETTDTPAGLRTGDGPMFLLRDNDPKGYQTGKGLKAESSAGFTVIRLPVYRPDLNPLDFYAWHEIEKKMKAEELQWVKGRKDSPAQFNARVRATAESLPAAELRKALGSMYRRVRQLISSGGAWTKGD